MILEFILALLPILWLIIALTALKTPGFKACSIALAIAYALAIFVWKMPIADSLRAVTEGAALALWPIVTVIIAAIFTYNVCVATSKMETIKKMLGNVTMDKRILVLIIAWGFGGFMEGMAGFGTAVAIPASMLWGLGFNPVFAAIVCLIANATPTAFGSIGIPTTTLSKITGLSVIELSTNTVTLLAIFIVITPFILVSLTGKLKTGKSKNPFKGIFLITLISGLAFLIPEYLVARYLGAELAVVIGSVCSMAATVFAAKFLYKGEVAPEYLLEGKKAEPVTRKEALVAWSPFILIFFFLLGTSKLIAPLNALLATVKTSVDIYTGAGGTPYTFSWLGTPVLWILLAAFIGGTIQGMRFGELITVLINTIRQMMKTVITIIAIMATAKLMGYSGMIASISEVFVYTGVFYPLFAPFLGSIGTFVTGSGTSASVLFGGLQYETSMALGLNQAWITASNTAGAVMAKMISPQSIAVAVAAVKLEGKENELLRGTIKYFVIFVLSVGILTLIGSRFLM